MDRTYISVPGLLSREVGSFLRGLVNGGEDVFVGEDLRRAFQLQAAFKAPRLGETTTKITRLGKGKLEEPKTEVLVKEEIYDEEEVDENEGFDDLKSQTEGLMRSLKDPDTGRTYWQCAECDYHNKGAKSSKFKVERHVMRHHMDKVKPTRREEEMMMGSLTDTTTSRNIIDELSDDEEVGFLEDADLGENFEMNDLKQESPVAYQPTTSSHVVGAGFSCETCGKCFKNRKERKQHSLRHNDVRYPCETCGKDFNTPRDLRKHISWHLNKANGVRYPCETCGKDFNTPRDLRKHVSRHLNKAKKMILCPVCARSVISEYHLKLHMRTHDKDIDESDTFCNICSKSFANIYNLKFHMQTHSQDFSGRRAQVLCSICSKLILKASLKQHMEVKHGEIKYAECEFCGAKLRKACIKQHQQLCNATEEERAAFKAAQQKSCNICGKVLSNSSKLKRHMKTHETHEMAVGYS